MKIAKIFTILARAGLALGGIGVTIPGDGTSTEFVEVSTSSALGGGTSMAEIYKVSFIKVPTSVISTELNSPVESSVESVSGSVTSAGVSSETLLSSVASSEAESTVVVSSTVEPTTTISVTSEVFLITEVEVPSSGIVATTTDDFESTVTATSILTKSCEKCTVMSTTFTESSAVVTSIANCASVGTSFSGLCVIIATDDESASMTGTQMDGSMTSDEETSTSTLFVTIETTTTVDPTVSTSENSPVESSASSVAVVPPMVASSTSSSSSVPAMVPTTLSTAKIDGTSTTTRRSTTTDFVTLPATDTKYETVYVSLSVEEVCEMKTIYATITKSAESVAPSSAAQPSSTAEEPIESVSDNSSAWPSDAYSSGIVWSGYATGTGVYNYSGTGVLPMVNRTSTGSVVIATGAAGSVEIGGAVVALVVAVGFAGLLI